MQNRMKQHPLSEEQMNELLETSTIGHLAMVDHEQAPYGIPVHFVLDQGNIYFHGLPKGEKIENIERDSRVCFTVYEMLSILVDDKDDVCNTNTEYNSVIIRGDATILSNMQIKESVLNKIVSKYTPQFTGSKLPENMIAGTAVIKITIDSITGKYYQ